MNLYEYMAFCKKNIFRKYFIFFEEHIFGFKFLFCFECFDDDYVIVFFLIFFVVI